MSKNSIISLTVLIVAFLLFTAANNLFLGGMRLDLTENDLYTLSDGTEQILQDIDEPINLYFFFSGKVSEDLTGLRAYADRVREMLQEYKMVAGEKINLKIIDPVPFSEEEDQAAGFGLQSVPVNQSGDELYFGLVGTNAVDDQQVIAFFQPDREEFLEYELSKLVYSLSSPVRQKIGLYANLPVTEDVDPTTYQATPAWVFLGQLKELFDVEELTAIDAEGLAAVDLLMLIHPKDLDETALFEIDQFIMGGGKLIAFIDPMAEMDRPAPGTPPMPGGNSSNLNSLTTHWGISLKDGEILGDSAVALTVGDAAGTPVRHLGILGFTADNLSQEDVVTSPLESVNVSTAGMLDVDEVAGITVESLIQSSEYAMPLPSMQFQFLTDPSDLLQGFAPTGEKYPVAVRVSGSATSAYPDGVDGIEREVLGSTDDLQVILVADTDILSDRLWVQVQSFFGQSIASAWADNGSFVTNLVDNLSGSSDLINVRSRGQFSRPFIVVQDLRREAEASYLQSAEDLQVRLTETEGKLTELESSRATDGLLTLTPEQEAAIIEFQNEKLKIRKELREVRHQLDKDIEQLGSFLKLLNVLLLPLLLTALLIGGRVLGLHRSQTL
jgi:ABC-type uncharacterized transport system involved in gliding motility auxiliary subunit